MIQLNEYYLPEPNLTRVAELLESRGFIVGVFSEQNIHHEQEPNKYSPHDFDPYVMDEEIQLKKAIREINQTTK